MLHGYQYENMRINDMILQSTRYTLHKRCNISIMSSNIPLCSEWGGTCSSPCRRANAPSSLPCCSAWLCVAEAAAVCRTDSKALTFPEHISTGVCQCDVMKSVMFRVAEGETHGRPPMIVIEDLNVSYCDLHFLVIIVLH